MLLCRNSLPLGAMAIPIGLVARTVDVGAPSEELGTTGSLSTARSSIELLSPS